MEEGGNEPPPAGFITLPGSYARVAEVSKAASTGFSSGLPIGSAFDICGMLCYCTNKLRLFLLQALGETYVGSLEKGRICPFCPRPFADHRRTSEHVNREHSRELALHGVNGTAALMINKSRSGTRHVLTDDTTAEISRLRRLFPAEYDRLSSAFKKELKNMAVRLLKRNNILVTPDAARKVTVDHLEITRRIQSSL